MEKKQCGICWEYVNKFNIVKAGCCSFNSCNDCIKQLKECPQCKKRYFWCEKSNDEIVELKMELAAVSIAYSNIYDELTDTKQKIENFNNEREWWASRINKMKEELDACKKITNNVMGILEDKAMKKRMEDIFYKYNLDVSLSKIPASKKSKADDYEITHSDDDTTDIIVEIRNELGIELPPYFLHP